MVDYTDKLQMFLNARVIHPRLVNKSLIPLRPGLDSMPANTQSYAIKYQDEIRTAEGVVFFVNRQFIIYESACEICATDVIYVWTKI